MNTHPTPNPTPHPTPNRTRIAVIGLSVSLVLFVILSITFIVLYTQALHFEIPPTDPVVAPMEKMHFVQAPDVMVPNVSKPNEMKVCLLVLTNESDPFQAQYQLLWKIWNQLFGIPNNITVYLLTAEENIPIYQFDHMSRLIMFPFKDSYVPGILKKTIGLLELEPNQYDWYVRVTSASFIDPQKLISLLHSLPAQPTPEQQLAGQYLVEQERGAFVQGRLIIFNYALAQYWKEHAAELYSLNQPDDIVLSQSIENCVHHPIQEPLFTLRSNDVDFATRLQQLKSLPGDYVGVNMVNNGMPPPIGSPDRSIDVGLFAYLLYRTVLNI